LTKNEFELQKLLIKSKTIRGYLHIVKHLVTMGAIIWCVYLMMNGLVEAAKSGADTVGALANLADKLNISGVVGWIATAAASGAYMLERKGKKRLLKQIADERYEREKGDPYSASSGLTETGDTPA
jgi:hypothetical protein